MIGSSAQYHHLFYCCNHPDIYASNPCSKVLDPHCKLGIFNSVVQETFVFVCEDVNRSPIRQEIIALLRLKGGKANWFDENGRYVGKGNGDLNH